MNRLNITGRLTKDIEIRTRQDGKTFGMFTVAVNRGFGKQQQNNEPTADFFTCFMNNVEKVAPYLLKGTQVGIDGSIHINTKKDQNGNYNTQVSVSVQQLELLGSKNSNGQPSATGAPVSVAPQTHVPTPQAPSAPAYVPQAPAPTYMPQTPAPAPVSAPPVPPVAQAPQAPAPAQYQAPPAGLADEDIPF